MPLPHLYPPRFIQRDGEELAQLPDKPVGRFGRPLLQAVSYHDTPEKPMPEIRFVERTAKAGVRHQYRVVAVNRVRLRSEPSKLATIP